MRTLQKYRRSQGLARFSSSQDHATVEAPVEVAILRRLWLRGCSERGASYHPDFQSWQNPGHSAKQWVVQVPLPRDHVGLATNPSAVVKMDWSQ